MSKPTRACAAHDQPFAQTLTGFKWIGRVEGLAFGYEEALGYCVDPQRTPDKDGISAALIAIAMAAELASQGKTLTDQLAELGELFGHYATGQISIRVTDLTVISKIIVVMASFPYFDTSI